MENTKVISLFVSEILHHLDQQNLQQTYSDNDVKEDLQLGHIELSC